MVEEASDWDIEGGKTTNAGYHAVSMRRKGEKEAHMLLEPLFLEERFLAP